jgi:uncharacterized protein YigE (DUF2233 family)
VNNFAIQASRVASLLILVFTIVFQYCSNNNEEVNPPSSLIATAVSADQIDLSWTDNSTSETGFKIERKTGTEAYAIVATIAKDLNIFSDKNLTANTTYTYRVFAHTSAGNPPAHSNEAVGTTLKIESLAVLNTASVSAVTPYSAVTGGMISSDGNSSITAKGVVWSTYPNPTVSLSTKTDEGNSSAVFFSSMTNLNWYTQYYVRSYATNSSGTAYGNEIVFTTGKVEVTTAAITNIFATSCWGGGTIEGDPGASLLSKGLVWSTSPNPTIALSTKANAEISAGAFQVNITSLSAGAAYYVRAYATNAFGTIYGNEVTFTTQEEFLTFITEASAIKLYWKDNNGQILRSLTNLKAFVEASGETLRFAMNGGMYLSDNSPQGLYIENEVQYTILNTGSGYGNFYLQPNGVFYITTDNTAVVCQTSSFSGTGNIKFATQSGPMLLIDGSIHPAFRQNSTSLNIRNGVGILPDGQVLFAMSKSPLNLYAFAEFFKSQGCANALYLDGAISRTYLPEKDWQQLDGYFGVMIGVNR